MKTKSTKPGRKTMYPWNKWLKSGSKHVLKKDRDFTCSIHSFVTYLYMKSSRVKKPISVSIPNDREVVLRCL